MLVNVSTSAVDAVTSSVSTTRRQVALALLNRSCIWKSCLLNFLLFFFFARYDDLLIEFLFKIVDILFLTD